jgi:hypothetical protein
MFGIFRKKETLEITIDKNEPEFASNETSNFEVNPQTKAMTDNAHGPKVWRKRTESQQKEVPQPVQESPIIEELKAKDPKESELESHVGKLVICISEQAENPTVGVGVEVVHITKGHEAMLSVYDIVRKEKTIPQGIIFNYSEQKFDALNQIDANARVALFFNRLGFDTIDKKSPSNRPLVSHDEWKKKVLVAIDKINRGDWS